MSLVSQVIIGRVEKFIGRVLAPAEKDEIRRMSELIGLEEDDLAWSIVLAMWAARTETTAALNRAREDISAGLEAWITRVESDMRAIDQVHRSMARDVEAQAATNTVTILQAAEQGTAALSARLTAMESQVAAMTTAVDEAMAGASGALQAAQKRDVEVQKQVKGLVDHYARDMTSRIDVQIAKVFHRAELQLNYAAQQARVATRPAVAWGFAFTYGVALGIITATLFLKGLIL